MPQAWGRGQSCSGGGGGGRRKVYFGSSHPPQPPLPGCVLPAAAAPSLPSYDKHPPAAPAPPVITGGPGPTVGGVSHLPPPPPSPSHRDPGAVTVSQPLPGGVVTQCVGGKRPCRGSAAVSHRWGVAGTLTGRAGQGWQRRGQEPPSQPSRCRSPPRWGGGRFSPAGVGSKGLHPRAWWGERGCPPGAIPEGTLSPPRG